MKFGKRAGALACLGVFMAVGLSFPALADTVYVTADRLNYRSQPSMSGAVAGTVLQGTSLERKENLGEWSLVSVGGNDYYAATRYLSQTAPAASAPAGGISQTAASTPYAAKSWEVGLSDTAPYASFAKITSGRAIYYESNASVRKGKTVCVNAGHGTKGGSSVKTQCHPDGSAKVTGGTTSSGAKTAVAVSSGMTFSDGTAESAVTLRMAQILRDRLLAEGYDVLMIREGSDVQLDNIARTVIANTNADCHLALHWDSTSSDKGCFYMSVPNNASYRAMEPVASHWESHNSLGNSLIEGLRAAGNKIFSSGSMEMDLTQTSYSTIPSVDIELGDKASPHSEETLNKLADGLVAGVNRYFGS